MTSNLSLHSLNDSALLSQFSNLVQRDREGKASLLRHIDAIDGRKLWARLGHPSLFDFLVTRHHMSEATAFKRIGAARTARRFPVLFEMVGRGEIHLSGIHRLKAHLTLENHEQMLALARHKTIREIETLVARLAPRPDAPTTLRALPNRTTTGRTLAAPAAATLGAPVLASPVLAAPPLASPVLAAPPLASPVLAAPPLDASTPEPAEATEAPAPARVTSAPAVVALAPAMVGLAAAALQPQRDPYPEPLAPGRYKLTVTISESTRGKLKQLEDLLGHQISKGDTAAILDRALDALLTEVHKRKTGLADRPRAQKPRAQQPKATATYRQTRHVPAAERRVVWPRDEGRCGFVGEDGHPCNETRGLQFAHREPWAKGGANTADNLGLRCVAHNALEADRDYGAGFMAHKRKQEQKQKRKPLQMREPLARYVLRGAATNPTLGDAPKGI